MRVSEPWILENMHPSIPTALPILVLLPLIIWRFYRRMRTSIGRQTLSKVRPWVTVSVFTVLIFLFAIATLANPERLWWLVGGVCVGSFLGVFGISKTAFENTPQGQFYTPNAHLGIALSALFAGRVIYRMFQLYSLGPGAPQSQADFARSPYTLAIFGLLAGYYVAYAIGLIRWRLSVTGA